MEPPDQVPAHHHTVSECPTTDGDCVQVWPDGEVRVNHKHAGFDLAAVFGDQLGDLRYRDQTSPPPSARTKARRRRKRR